MGRAWAVHGTATRQRKINACDASLNKSRRSVLLPAYEVAGNSYAGKIPAVLVLRQISFFTYSAQRCPRLARLGRRKSAAILEYCEDFPTEKRDKVGQRCDARREKTYLEEH